MASEMRRIAKALVEHRSERFESRHPLDESKRRLDAALARLKPEGTTRITYEWKAEGGASRLDVHFAPSPRAQRKLQLASSLLALLVAAGAWAMFSSSAPASIAFLLALVAALAILGFPFVAVALGSQREAEEARVGRAIRAALADEADD